MKKGFFISILIFLAGYGTGVSRSNYKESNISLRRGGGASRSIDGRQLGEIYRNVNHFESLATGTNASIRAISPEVIDRMNRGFYVLGFDIPWERERMDAKAVHWSLKYQKRVVETEYSPLFSKLGLSKESEEKLEYLLLQIEKARCLAEAYAVQMDKAKESFDQQIKNLLPSESYREFRRTELERPAIRRFGEITNYLATAIGHVPNMQLDALYSALAINSTYSLPDGPYGRGMSATATTAGVLKYTTEELDRLKTEFAKVIAELPSSPDWQRTRDEVQNFYAQQIGKKVKVIEMINGRIPLPSPYRRGDAVPRPVLTNTAIF